MVTSSFRPEMAWASLHCNGKNRWSQLRAVAYSAGESGYTAPEQINGEACTLSDFFALGRTFVYLLTGRHPLTMYDAQFDVLNWRSHASHISPSLLDFIDELMARFPGDRPANTQEILQRLEEIDC